jgi:hypothetical protein
MFPQTYGKFVGFDPSPSKWCTKGVPNHSRRKPLKRVVKNVIEQPPTIYIYIYTYVNKFFVFKKSRSKMSDILFTSG